MNAEFQAPLAYGQSEAAKLLGISLAKLKQHIKARRIRSVKDGRRRLIPAEALREWLESLAAN
jgi:excisionase family DNA binding protein